MIGPHVHMGPIKIWARPSPPPFRAMPERNRFFLWEVFPNCPLYLDINVIFCFVSFVPKCCLCVEKKITFGIPCNILVEKRALKPEIGVFQFAKYVVTKDYPKAPWLLCYSRFQKVFHVLVVLPK